MKALWLALLVPCIASAQCVVPLCTAAKSSGTPLYMGPTLDGSYTVDATGSGTTVSTAGLTVPTAGDTVFIAVSARNSGTFTVTDSKGQTYTQIWVSPFESSLPGYTALFYLPNSASGSLTVTASITVSGGSMAIWAQPIKNANASTPLDSTFSSTFVTSSSSGSVSNGSCGTARTPGQNNTLVFSFANFDNTTPSVGANYTLLNTTDFMYLQYWQQATATSTTGAWVSSADDWIVGCAGFHS